MSDIFLMCMMIVKGCQTLVMGPTRLLQQPLVSTVPHYLQHAALIIESCKGEKSWIWQKSSHNFDQHIIDVWHLS